MKKLLLTIACVGVGIYDLLFGVSAFGFAIGWLPFSWGMASLLAIGGWKAARRIEPKRGTILGAAALLAVWWWRNRPKQRAALQARISMLERDIWPERFGTPKGVGGGALQVARANYSQLMQEKRSLMTERAITRAKTRAAQKKAQVRLPALSNLLDDLPTILCACGAAAKVSSKHDLPGRRWILTALCHNCHKYRAVTINDFMLHPKPNLTASALTMMVEAYFRRLQAEMARPDKTDYERALEQQRLYQRQLVGPGPWPNQDLYRCAHGVYPDGACPYCLKVS